MIGNGTTQVWLTKIMSLMALEERLKQITGASLMDNLKMGRFMDIFDLLNKMVAVMKENIKMVN